MSLADRLADAAPQDEPVLTEREAAGLGQPGPTDADLDAIEGRRAASDTPRPVAMSACLSREHRRALMRGWTL